MVSCKFKCKMSDCLSAIRFCVLVNVETYGYSVGNFQNPKDPKVQVNENCFCLKSGQWRILVYSQAEFAVYF